MKQNDLAEKKYWNSIYSSKKEKIKKKWTPASYEELCLKYMLLKEIEFYKPKNILEIGCGDSTWLPYLAKKMNLNVFGMDYSEEGCNLAKNRLKNEKINGKIFCQDIFKAKSSEIGQYDFVYSLGVVEHFTDTENIISNLLKFVKPGGVILTEIPNLRSIHGILSWLYQPKQLAKHKIITQKELIKIYKKLELKNSKSHFVGAFTINIVAWGYNQRFPKADKILLKLVNKINRRSNKHLKYSKTFRGSSIFSPFLYIIGVKNETPKASREE
jgi:2-polyprenyl-3-methyl-5-hydroxy-6-metoxy-1,4-benzoquinol methylase